MKKIFNLAFIALLMAISTASMAWTSGSGFSGDSNASSLAIGNNTLVTGYADASGASSSGTPWTLATASGYAGAKYFATGHDVASGEAAAGVDGGTLTTPWSADAGSGSAAAATAFVHRGLVVTSTYSGSDATAYTLHSGSTALANSADFDIDFGYYANANSNSSTYTGANAN